MTRNGYLSEELINERLLEEIRENIEGGFQLLVDKPRYKSVAARVYIALTDFWSLSQSESAVLLRISEEIFEAWKAG